jgi:hypothetical protein
MVRPNVVNSVWMNAVDRNSIPAAAMWTLQNQSQRPLAPYAALLAATQALSCTAIYSIMEQMRRSITATASSGSYCTSWDQAVMVVQSANASAQLVIPGPIEAIFKGDHYTVDLENSLVQTWWSEVQALLGDSIGSPWTQLKHGYRRNIANL